VFDSILPFLPTVDHSDPQLLFSPLPFPLKTAHRFIANSTYGAGEFIFAAERPRTRKYVKNPLIPGSSETADNLPDFFQLNASPHPAVRPVR